MLNVKKRIYVFLLLINRYLSSESTDQSVVLKERIVKGRTCTGENHSFMVSLQVNSSFHFCGGTLLNEYWVLTAAHCLIKVPYHVVAGRDTPGQEVREIKKAYPHPYFKSTGLDDIALLRMRLALNESKYISYVNIPSGVIRGEIKHFCPVVLAMGWGKISDTNKHSSPTLQCVDLPVLSEEECRKYYRPVQWAFVTAMCTLSQENKNVCHGDSGGPIICQEKDLQLGIVSFGRYCEDPSSPGVYTRVDDYLGFIHRTISGNKLVYATQCIIWALLLGVSLLI